MSVEKLSDSEYRQLMDCPMEDLAFELWGIGDESRQDHKIVEIAARKIRFLKSMLLACGVKENVLKAIMDDA